MKCAAFVLLTLCTVPQLACRTSAKNRRIAVIPRITSNAQWLSLHVGVAEEAEKQNVEVFWHGPSNDSDVQEQVEIAGQAVRQKAYGIIVRPSTYFAMNRVIQQALAGSIPVVILGEDVGIPARPHLYYVLNDTKEMSRLIASRLKDVLHGSGNIALLGLQPDTPGSVKQSAAIGEALSQTAPGIHVVTTMRGATSNSYLEQAAEQLIRQRPDLNAIVALDAENGYSAAAAAHAMGVEGRIKIIVCGQTLDLLLLLRAGVVDSILVENMRAMGARAVDDVVADRKGRSVPARTTIEPAMVTLENIDTEAMQQMLLMHGRHS